jgi:hypothetical protein
VKSDEIERGNSVPYQKMAKNMRQHFRNEEPLSKRKKVSVCVLRSKGKGARIAKEK